MVTASASLLEALAQHRPEEYKGCVPFAVNRLSRIVTALHTDQLVTLLYCFANFTFMPKFDLELTCNVVTNLEI